MQIYTYINEKGGKGKKLFCQRCARYKHIWNDRLGNSTFITDSRKGHQFMLESLYQ